MAIASATASSSATAITAAADASSMAAFAAASAASASAAVAAAAASVVAALVVVARGEAASLGATGSSIVPLVAASHSHLSSGQKPMAQLSWHQPSATESTRALIRETARQPALTVAAGALAKDRAAPASCAGSPCSLTTQAQRSVGQKPERQLCEHHWSSTAVPAILEQTWPPGATAATATAGGAAIVGVTGATAAAAHGRPGFWLSEAAAAPALRASASAPLAAATLRSCARSVPSSRPCAPACSAA